MNWYKRYLIAEKVQKDDNNFSWMYIDIPKDIKKNSTRYSKRNKRRRYI